MKRLKEVLKMYDTVVFMLMIGMCGINMYNGISFIMKPILSFVIILFYIYIIKDRNEYIERNYEDE